MNQKKTPVTGSRTAREAQERRAARRSNIMYGAIAVAFLLVAVSVIVWKSNIIQKTTQRSAVAGAVYLTAADSADPGSSSSSSSEDNRTLLAEYTVPEVNYYFRSIYQNFVQQNGAYLSYFGLNTSADLREQPYPGGEDETWFDYFMEQAMTQMADVSALNDDAEKNGYTWNDAHQAELDSSLASLETTAAAGNLSVNKYLQKAYGVSMTRDIYEAQLKRVILASAYSQNYSDSLTYTDADLDAAYAAAPKSYDVVDYQSVRLDGAAASTTDADGNPVEPTEAESAAALAAAKSAADAMYAGFQAGQALETLAEGNDAASYTNGAAASYSSSVLMDWLFDSARQPGDSAVLADEDGAAYYVASFSSRYRQEYNTVNVRHILIQPESGPIAEGEDGYEDQQAALKADAQAKAEDLLAQWKAGAATEDAFAQLANENSVDGGSNTNGGLYEQVYQGQMVAAFNDWCFDAARQPGDTGVVETDYGYHVMYFVGYNLPYWKVQVQRDLRSSDYEAWYAGVTAGYVGEAVDSGAKYLG